MAGKARASTGSLALRRTLEAEAYRFSFFQALRRLEAGHPELPGLGRSLKPADDPLRLTQEPSLGFAPSSLASFEPGRNRVPDRLAVYFTGLFGPNGPLPIHLTEYAIQRKLDRRGQGESRGGDQTFSRFADVFHHRMLSLLYRAWADARPAVGRDRPQHDRFKTYVGALFGIGHPSLQDRDALPDTAKLHYAGLLGMQNRPPSGLEGMLEHFFGTDARVLEWQGAWMTIPARSRTRLSDSRGAAILGVDTLLGKKAWGRQQRFRVGLGPLSASELWRILPGTASMDRLIAIVRNFAGDERDWDLQLDVRVADVEPLRLGSPNRLGWTTWLGHIDKAVRTVSDVVIDAPLEAQVRATAHEATARPAPAGFGHNTQNTDQVGSSHQALAGGQING